MKKTIILKLFTRICIKKMFVCTTNDVMTDFGIWVFRKDLFTKTSSKLQVQLNHHKEATVLHRAILLIDTEDCCECPKSGKNSYGFKKPGRFL